MYTIVETEAFRVQVDALWGMEERMAFFTHIALNPLDGDLIPGSGGLRKVRWSMAGRGKRGGSRVIYFNLLDDGVMVMLAIYAKSDKESDKESVSPGKLKKLKGERHEKS